MKKLILMFTVAIVAATLQSANAQVSVSINIGAQPSWGPRGYDYVEYYYMPEVRSYYHVPTKRFVYLDGNRWVHRKKLPRAYRNYNLYNVSKIVVNKPKAYLQHQNFKPRYVETRQRISHSKQNIWNRERVKKNDDRNNAPRNRHSDKGHARGGRN